MAGPPEGADRPGGFRMPRRGDTRPDGRQRRPGPPPAARRPAPGPAAPPPWPPPTARPGPDPRPGRPAGRPPPPPPGPDRPAGGRSGPTPTRVAPAPDQAGSPRGPGSDGPGFGGPGSGGPGSGGPGFGGPGFGGPGFGGPGFGGPGFGGPGFGGPGAGARTFLDRVRAPAAKRVLLLVLAGASVLLLLISGGVTLAARSIDSGLSRVDVISTSLGAAVGTDQNILLVGLGARTDSLGNPLPPDQLAALHAGGSNDGGNQTDTVIVLHIPGGGGPATGFSIPRDSYVDLPDGFGKHKINSAYTYGENAARPKLAKDGVTGNQLAVQAGAAGAKTTIGAVESLTGLTITHFAAVNLAGFADISQAIGGVAVCLNSKVDDSFSGANFPAGQQTVSGAQALAFVRQRHGLPGGDLDRARRQQVFLSSMAHTVLSSSTLTDSTKRNALVDAVDKAVTVDRSLDTLSLGTQLQGVSSGSLGFHTIPIVNASYDTADDGEAVQVNPSAVQKYISDTVSGSSSSGSSSTQTSGASGSPQASGGSSSASSAAPKTIRATAVPSPDAGTTAPTVPCVN